MSDRKAPRCPGCGGVRFTDRGPLATPTCEVCGLQPSYHDAPEAVTSGAVLDAVMRPATPTLRAWRFANRPNPFTTSEDT